MSDYFSPLRNKSKDPEGIYISPKALIYIIVFLIFFFILVFLSGVYLGRNDVLTTLSKDETTVTSETTTNTETTPKTDSKPTTDNQTSTQTSPPDTTSGNAIPTSSVNESSAVQPLPQPSTGTTSTNVSVQQNTPTETTPVNTPVQQDTPTGTTSPPPAIGTTTVPENKPQTQKPTELTPITPPIDQDVNGSDKSKPSPDTTPTETTVKQNPKTFSIQLSALSGEDAENRAKTLIEKMKKKYNQFQFKIQSTGKLYKISVINLPDEKAAKEALNILSQEPNFKKAFIVKPQK